MTAPVSAVEPGRVGSRWIGLLSLANLGPLPLSADRSINSAGFSDWQLTFQSRSGRPGDPWLEPDVCDYLRAERARGLAAAVLSPIGFVCDHIEVLYDLDREAADVCADIGLPMARAESVNDDPMFLDMMAVGEQTGKFGDTMQMIADVYERELDKQVKVISALIPPLIMLVIASVVGLVVFGILSAVFGLTKSLRPGMH